MNIKRRVDSSTVKDIKNAVGVSKVGGVKEVRGALGVCKPSGSGKAKKIKGVQT